MGITDRKLRQKEEVRASILDTAWEMVVTEGWHSFSIRKIADAIAKDLDDLAQPVEADRRFAARLRGRGVSSSNRSRSSSCVGL